MIRQFIAATSGAVVILVVAAVVLCAMPVHACEMMVASWYGNEHNGRKTASGARFNQWAMTAAMPSRAHLGERWRVSYGLKSVVVTVTDTGGFAKYGRGMDLARGAFAKLASTDKGVIRIKACKLG